jgi:PIN domain nuclease of toxin-antitoxin system
MRCLLDTCILLWALDGNLQKLGSFTDIIVDPKNDIIVSVVSHWEITIKTALGKLVMEDDLEASVIQSGFTWLPVTCSHIKSLATLPLLHHDPFDRLLIAQAKAEGFTLLTHDSTIHQYETHR